MSIISKLGIFFTLTILGILFFCFYWLDNPGIQVALLLVNVFIMLYLFGIRRLIGELLLLSPFLIMVSIIYGALATFHIAYPGNYWLIFGITRTALLISSMFYMQFMLSWIKMEEILDLPLKIDAMKYIILGNLLYKAAVSSYAEIVLYMDLMPSEQIQKRNWILRLNMKLSCLLALLGFILSLATSKGEVIDEHIAHCYKGACK